MLNEPFLQPRRQGDAKRVHVSKKHRARSFARSLARPREFVNSWSNFGGAGTTLLRSRYFTPSRWSRRTLSRPARGDTLRRSISRRASWKWEASITVRSSPLRPLPAAARPYRRGPLRRQSRRSPSHHARLSREKPSHPPAPTRTIMKDINYNFISNYR
jgi:hypothetical protein